MAAGRHMVTSDCSTSTTATSQEGSLDKIEPLLNCHGAKPGYGWEGFALQYAASDSEIQGPVHLMICGKKI